MKGLPAIPLMKENRYLYIMGKTFQPKHEFKKLVRELGIRAAKTEASRHPGGTRAKGLRKLAQDKVHLTDDRNRFGDAYEKSSRMRRIRRYVKHAARNAARQELTQSQEEQQ